MPKEPIPGCVLLTDDNVDRIVEVAAKRGFTIDHLRDNMDCNAKYDDCQTMLFTSVYPWIPAISNFNDVPFDGPTDDVDDILMTTEEFLALLESTPEIS